MDKRLLILAVAVVLGLGALAWHIVQTDVKSPEPADAAQMPQSGAPLDADGSAGVGNSRDVEPSGKTSPSNTESDPPDLKKNPGENSGSAIGNSDVGSPKHNTEVPGGDASVPKTAKSSDSPSQPSTQRLWQPTSGGAFPERILGRLPLWDLGSQQREYALSRDGKLVVVGGDEVVMGVDATSGEILWQQDNRATPSYGIAISADGLRVFTIGPKGALTERSTSDGKLTRTVDDVGYAFGAAINAAGTALAIGFNKRATVKLFNPEAMTETGVCEGLGGRYRQVKFSLDGFSVYGLCEVDDKDNSTVLYCWNTPGGAATKSWTQVEIGVVMEDFAISPDGSFAVIAGENPESRRDTVITFNLETGSLICVPEQERNARVSGAALNHAGTLAASCIGGALKLWNPQDGSIVRSCAGTSYGQRLKFSHDDSRVYELDNNGRLRAWYTETGELVNPADDQPTDAGRATQLAFTSDGKRVLSSGGGPSRLWNVETGALLRQFGNAYYGGLCGDVVFTLERDVPTLWDIETGELLKELTKAPSRDIAALVCSTSSARLLGLTRDGNLYVWSTTSGVLEQTLSLPPRTTGKWSTEKLAVSADGNFATVFTREGEFWQFDIDVGEPRLLAPQSSSGTRAIDCLRYTPDGTGLWFSEGYGKPRLALIDSSTASTLRELDCGIKAMSQAQAFALGEFELTPDGTMALIGGWAPAASHPLVLIELMEGKVLARFSGHTDSLSAVAISPDGKTGASIGRDRMIRIWDLTHRD